MRLIRLNCPHTGGEVALYSPRTAPLEYRRLVEGISDDPCRQGPTLLETHFDKYPDDENGESEKGKGEFSEITDELSEPRIRIDQSRNRWPDERNRI